MDDIIDELISDAVLYGEVSTGAPLNWMAARGYDPKAIISHAAGHTPAKRAGWTDEEEEYLRQNLGWLSEQQMADILGEPWKASISTGNEKCAYLPPRVTLTGCHVIRWQSHWASHA